MQVFIFQMILQSCPATTRFFVNFCPVSLQVWMVPVIRLVMRPQCSSCSCAAWPQPPLFLHTRSEIILFFHKKLSFGSLAAVIPNYQAYAQKNDFVRPSAHTSMLNPINKLHTLQTFWNTIRLLDRVPFP